jgi:hypothetical protein
VTVQVYTKDAQYIAADYRDRGWSPIPLRIRSKEPKLPKGHPFLSRSATDDEFEAFDFRHNVGIVTGKVSGFIVLDDDDDGATLAQHDWHVPPTPTAKTARGHQYYFRCPDEGFPTFDVTGKLEVRGDGAYVAAPPSVHPSGVVYEWVISPDEAELADPPEWLIEEASLHRRRMHAEDVGETIGNGSRNKTLFSIAGTLRRRGLDEASIAGALLGINTTACEGPLGEDEVRKIARSAARYEPAENVHSRSHSLGNMGRRNDPVGTIRAVSFRGREKPDPREWIVARAICKGHPASWYGEGGIAKSLLAAHMGLHIAADGVDYWAGLRVKTMPVLYGDFELDEAEHLRRAQDLAAGMGLPDVPAKFHYLPLAGLPAAEAFRIAAEECHRLRAGLFVVDSVGFALDGDSELSRDVLRFYRECIQPIRAAGTTPFLIDHQAKVIKGEKYSDKQEFGSVYKTNSVRSSFQLRGAWDGNELTATFTHKKTNFGPKVEDFSLKLVFAAERIEVGRLDEAVPNPDKEPSKKEQVLDAVAEMGKATAESAARRTGLNLKTVQNAITDLLREGLLTDTGKKEGKSRIVIPHSLTTQGTGTGMKQEAVYSRQTPSANGENKSNGQKVTEVMEVTPPSNLPPHLSADEGNRRMQQLTDEGMSESFAVAQLTGRDLGVG